MSAILSPSPLQHFDTATGAPASGYKLFTYLAGTTTKTPTYTDSSGATPNTNPILLDSLGNANVWLASGVTYKYALALPTDSDPPANPIWTVDNITGGASGTPTFQGVGATTGSANAQVLSNVTPAYSRTAGNVIYILWGFTNSGALTLNIAGTGAIAVKKKAATGLVNLTGNEVQANTWSAVIDDGTVYELQDPATISVVANSGLIVSGGSLTLLNSLQSRLADYRLTLTSGTPITITDVTAATTIFCTPYKGNMIALYDGIATWSSFAFAEMSIAVPASTSQMYDVFCYNNSGTPTLELLAWTNDTTRATALVLQDGVLVKSGAATRRYLGSFRTTTVSGQTEDSLAKRYVWNFTNRAQRPFKGIDTTDTWTYTTATFRKFNNAATADVGVVCGLDEAEVCAFVAGMVNNSAGVAAGVGLGIDSATVNSAQVFSPGRSNATPNTYATPTAQYNGFPGVGFHTLSPLEISVASGTSTWNGDGGVAFEQTGLTGYIRG